MSRPMNPPQSIEQSLTAVSTNLDRATLADFPRIRSVLSNPRRMLHAAAAASSTASGRDSDRGNDRWWWCTSARKRHTTAREGSDASGIDRRGLKRSEREKKQETKEERGREDRIAGDYEERRMNGEKGKERKRSIKKSSGTGVCAPLCVYIYRCPCVCARERDDMNSTWATIGARSAETLRERRSAAAMLRWTIYFCSPLTALLYPLRSVYSMPTTTDRRSSLPTPLLLLQRRNVLFTGLMLSSFLTYNLHFSYFCFLSL